MALHPSCTASTVLYKNSRSCVSGTTSPNRISTATREHRHRGLQAPAIPPSPEELRQPAVKKNIRERKEQAAQYDRHPVRDRSPQADQDRTQKRARGVQQKPADALHLPVKQRVRTRQKREETQQHSMFQMQCVHVQCRLLLHHLEMKIVSGPVQCFGRTVHTFSATAGMGAWKPAQARPRKPLPWRRLRSRGTDYSELLPGRLVNCDRFPATG